MFWAQMFFINNGKPNTHFITSMYSRSLHSRAVANDGQVETCEDTRGAQLI